MSNHRNRDRPAGDRSHSQLRWPDAVPGVSLTTIGYICIAGGLVAITVGLITNAQATRRHNVVEHRHDTVR